MRPGTRFSRAESGSVSVEMGLLATIMILLTGGAVEAGWAYYQYSSTQQAARHGARLAATLDPVADTLDDAASAATGFDITCRGSNQSCDSGSYDSAAMQRLVFGPDSDRTCGANTRERRGMCDVYGSLALSDVSVRYTSSGYGGLDPSANPAPLVTVTVHERPLKTVFLGSLLPGKFTTLPEVSATLMGEDLDG